MPYGGSGGGKSVKLSYIHTRAYTLTIAHTHLHAQAYLVIDCRHSFAFGIDGDALDRGLGIRNSLLVVVGLQVPNVYGTRLVPY